MAGGKKRLTENFQTLLPDGTGLLAADEHRGNTDKKKSKRLLEEQMGLDSICVSSAAEKESISRAPNLFPVSVID